MAVGYVVGILNYRGQILVGKKRSDSEKFLAGLWHIPGETIEFGEDNPEALRRGFREEAGIEICVGRYIDKHTSDDRVDVRWYECFYRSGELRAGSDLADIKFVDRSKVIESCDDRAVELWPEGVLRYFRV